MSRQTSGSQDLVGELSRSLQFAFYLFDGSGLCVYRGQYDDARPGNGVAVTGRDLAGTVVQVGVPTPDMTFPQIPMIDFFGHGGALKPSWYGDCLPSRDFPALVELYLQGRFALDKFVTERIALGDVEDAFHKMERGEVLRSVVVL